MGIINNRLIVIAKAKYIYWQNTILLLYGPIDRPIGLQIFDL